MHKRFLTFTAIVALVIGAALGVSTTALAQTAECSDGWVSNSANIHGPCSHHGGVEVWLDEAMKEQANQWCDDNPDKCASSHWAGIEGHGNHPAGTAEGGRNGVEQIPRMTEPEIVLRGGEEEARPAFAHYGAIAWDRATGKYGMSWNQPTGQRAEEVALSECVASGCKVVGRLGPRMCGALATTGDGKQVGAAWRKDRETARLDALKSCTKATAGECIVRAIDCNK
jgi:hypothetical protein